MRAKICPYFDNHQSACTLMIDDLASVAVVPAGEKISAKYDWGYLMDGPDSLYYFLEEQLLKAHPEIRGTVFLPLSSYKQLHSNEKYRVFTRTLDVEFMAFLNRIRSRFDFAFHGTWHSKAEYNGVHSTPANIELEFTVVKPPDIERIRREIDAFSSCSGISFSGGKYPGYKNNEFAETLIEELGFLWWMSDASMINKISKFSRHRYIGKGNIILDLPTTISGSLFAIIQERKLKQALRYLKKAIKGTSPTSLLDELVQKQFPITVQEHFQNQGPSGKRQKPNVFDDIQSLKMLFDHFRKFDLWYCTCSELAAYLENADHAVIHARNDGEFELTYTGRYSDCSLSLLLSTEKIIRPDNRKLYTGRPVHEGYVFNGLGRGIYSYNIEQS